MVQAVNPKFPPPQKKNSQFLSLCENHELQNFPKRCLLVGKKVLYKFSINIAPLSLTLHAINGWFIFWQITQMAIARTMDPRKIVPYCCTFMPIYGSKFKIPKNGQLALIGSVNSQSVTYSKFQTKVCR